MRKFLTLTLASSAVLGVACRDSSSHRSAAVSADLSRDLTLASQTQNVRINPDEIAPESHQTLALKKKKAPHAPQVIRDEHPTVRAAATPALPADLNETVPQATVTASAPAPAQVQAPDAPPLARPTPVNVSTAAGDGQSDGIGDGRYPGGGIGTVIRGGGIGDDDHCDPRGLPRGRGIPSGGGIGMPVFMPRSHGRPHVVIRFGLP